MKEDVMHIRALKYVVLVISILALVAGTAVTTSLANSSLGNQPFDQVIRQNGQQMMLDGKQTFRFDTFGDEAFWGGTLMLHQAIEGEKFGGVGPGVSPATALSVGLKVDVDALTKAQIKDLKANKVDLNDPAVTLALLKQNAVVGLTGFFNKDGSLQSIGIQ